MGSAAALSTAVTTAADIARAIFFGSEMASGEVVWYFTGMAFASSGAP